MWIVSQARTWIPLYVVLVGLMIYKYRNWKAVLLILVGFGIAVGLSDWTTSGLIKPWVCRLRPTHDPILAGQLHLVNDYTGGLYGFCSSHAANTMAVGLLFSLLYKNIYATFGLMLWVALNCYSRMYLGVHFLLDILCGLAIGALYAGLVYWGWRRAMQAGGLEDSSCSPPSDGVVARQGGS